MNEIFKGIVYGVMLGSFVGLVIFGIFYAAANISPNRAFRYNQSNCDIK
jgi:uncharacterized membrane protein